MTLPSVSIIIATFNSARTLDACLSSIRNQEYPKKLIEIVIVDGGSSDETLSIAKRYDCKIVVKKGYGAEAAKSFGLKKSRGSIVGDMGSDNMIPDTKWLHRIIRPFTQNVNIVGSYPLRYTYRAQDSAFNRYVSLFGVNDPVPYYMNKADRQSYLEDTYSLAGKVTRRQGYCEVTFNTSNLPTVGANGFFIRRSVLKKALIDPAHYFHIDIVHDVVAKGFNTFSVVNTGIVHDTADSLWSLVQKRRRYLKELYLQKKNVRRYHVVNLGNRKDFMKLAKFIFYSLTIIQPLWLSFRGYKKKQDIAWFAHPLFCFLITLVYAESFITSKVKK